MNKVILVGRLTADPELKQTQSGISSCRFTVAVNRPYKNQKGEYESDFISCVAWRQTAEFVSRYFNKGQMIALEGSMRNSTYQDRNHQDVTHYKTDVYVDNVEFCGSKNNNTNTAPAPAPAAQAVQAAQAAGVQTEQVSLSEFEEILSDGDVPF